MANLDLKFDESMANLDLKFDEIDYVKFSFNKTHKT